jgi:hypothetical protein
MQRLHSATPKADPAFSGDAFSFGARPVLCVCVWVGGWVAGQRLAVVGLGCVPRWRACVGLHCARCMPRRACTLTCAPRAAAAAAAGSVDVHAGGLKKHIRCAGGVCACCTCRVHPARIELLCALRCAFTRTRNAHAHAMHTHTNVPTMREQAAAEPRAQRPAVGCDGAVV